jgi:hypothetical protein
MAYNFLDKCPAYVARVREDVRLRRSLVCGYLQDDYTLPGKNSGLGKRKLKAELKSKNIDTTDATLQNDRAIFRTAYLYLTEPLETQAGFAQEAKKKNPAAYVGVACLIRDGLSTLDELSEVPEVEIGTGDRVSGEDEVNLDSYSIIEAELAKIKAESEAHLNTITRLHEELQSLTKERDSLRLQLQSVRNIVVQKSPSSTSVFKPTAEPVYVTHSELELLRSSLPTTYQWNKESGKVVTTSLFLSALSELPKQDRKRVLKQVRILTGHGSDYPSLKTKKIYNNDIPNTVAGSFSSRGTGEIRFTWDKTPGKLKLLFIVRRGDTGWSEA